MPVAIDFLQVESLPDAIAKATERMRVLKKKYRARIGCRIEDDRARIGLGRAIHRPMPLRSYYRLGPVGALPASAPKSQSGTANNKTPACSSLDFVAFLDEVPERLLLGEDPTQLVVAVTSPFDPKQTTSMQDVRSGRRLTVRQITDDANVGRTPLLIG
jgi:hypothetical protein